jgi:hypothetical protein
MIKIKGLVSSSDYRTEASFGESVTRASEWNVTYGKTLLNRPEFDPTLQADYRNISKGGDLPDPPRFHGRGEGSKLGSASPNYLYPIIVNTKLPYPKHYAFKSYSDN